MNTPPPICGNGGFPASSASKPERQIPIFKCNVLPGCAKYRFGSDEQNDSLGQVRPQRKHHETNKQKREGQMGWRKAKKSGTTIDRGNPLHLIALFALPLMAGNVFQQLIYRCGHRHCGKARRGGAGGTGRGGLADWMVGIIQGITQGFSILISQKYGSGNMSKCAGWRENSCVFAAVCAVVLCVASQFAIKLRWRF